jgi:uncharacterized protein with gpF-like domain
MKAVANARAELSDPVGMGSYFDRKLRDRRFDRIVNKAIADGVPVSAADRDRIITRYSDRLLFQRGETIARTETIASLSAGRDEGVKQLIDTGSINADQVQKIWRAAGDQRTRDTHADRDGQAVSIDGLFVSSSGATLAYPGDTSHGAPAEETINCRCYSEVKIDFLKGVR